MKDKCQFFNFYKKFITTNEMAEALKIKPQTIRKRYCLTGSYYGCRPHKLSNGMLRWPIDSVLKLF